MTDYIVSEEELRELTDTPCLVFDTCKKENECVECGLIDFLKSKQPVELVAEGEISTVYYNKHLNEAYIDGVRIPDKFERYDKQPIKIYIAKDTK